jgi:hypothetical protein
MVTWSWTIMLGWRWSASAAARRSVRPSVRSASRTSSPPASEVIVPPSCNACTTRRPWREKVTPSVVHSVIAMVLASVGPSGVVTEEPTGTWTSARADREDEPVKYPG